MTDAAPRKEGADPLAWRKLNFHSYANIFPLLRNQRGVLRTSGRHPHQWSASGNHPPPVRAKSSTGAIATMPANISILEPSFQKFPEDRDALADVISANLHRRHLNETQRGIVASKIANMRRGGKEANPSKDGNANVSQANAAKLLNVSTKTVERASKLVNSGIPELVTHAEQGMVKSGRCAQVRGEARSGTAEAPC